LGPIGSKTEIGLKNKLFEEGNVFVLRFDKGSLIEL
jgi:hypothetical protein